MALSPWDEQQLRRALTLAESAVGVSDPNPRVGCVLADATGHVVGDGFTQPVGGPHAEVMALRAASAAGAQLVGGTAWVTLEPCAHQGRTPPCADALISAGLKRVVALLVDPFAQVAGQGLARMRAAGLQVDLAEATSALARDALALNIGFFSRVRRARPWVRLKLAASLDGRTALFNGVSQWLTGPPARADGHAWRKRAGAVMTGSGTVLTDDPRLDVRLVDSVLQPLRVVVDSALVTPPAARLLQAPGSALVFTRSAVGASADALRACGAEVCALPDPHGRVDLPALLTALAKRGVNELHVEAGATLNGVLLRAGLVDELLLYLAPCIVGPGRDLALLPPLSSLGTAQPLRFIDHATVGADLRLRALTSAGCAFVDG